MLDQEIEEFIKGLNPVIKNELIEFTKFLKTQNLKITSQRLLVAKTIFSTHNHFTADSLLEVLKDFRDKISKATIYRILSLMVEAKLLQEHDFGKSYKFYEHIIGHDHHDHIICIDCGKILEFLDPEIEKRQEIEAKKQGFSINGHHLIIYGYCVKENCEQKIRT